MANYISTPNMLLPNPVPGIDPGPDYANNLQSCLNILDQHNHAPGSGVQITPEGLNINENLSFNNNAAAMLLQTSYVIQSAQTGGLTSLYAFGSNGELWWNDGAGNQVQLTSGGVVNATSSGISSGTASASFVSSILVVTQSVGVGAAIDAASYILRYNGSYPSPSGNYIILAAPSSLSGGYQLTFPATASPSNGTLLTSSTAGALSYSTPDQVGQAMTSTGANAIANSRTRATGSTVAEGGVATSSNSGNYTSSSGSYVSVAGLSVTITTTGRPVFVGLMPVAGSSGSMVGISSGGSSGLVAADFKLLNNTSSTSSVISVYYTAPSGGGESLVPPGGVYFIDFPAAGTYNYILQVQCGGSPQVLSVNQCVLVAYEL